jgi:hypothetical protein
MLTVRRKRGSSEAEPVNIQRFIIDSVSTDSLSCHYIDDENQTATVYKSEPLQGEDGREVTISGKIFTETVYPPFSVGDEIVAGQFQMEDGDEVEWVDITPGRHWRIDMREVVVCIGSDSNWRMLVPGSAPYRPI